MSVELLINAIIAGLLLGGFYAAVTVGMSISFGMLDIVNIAHPAFIILGSYIAYIVNSDARHRSDPRRHPRAAGVLRARRRRSIRSTTSSFEKRGQEALRGLAFFFGLLFITEVVLILVFGVDYRYVEAAYIGPTWHFGFVDLPLRMLVPCVVSLLMVGAAAALPVAHLHRPRHHGGGAGSAGAAADGGRPDPIKRIAFGISIATASLAGAFLIIIQPVEPSVGREYIGRVFAICVLGGLGSLPGTVIAAMLLGVVESLTATFYGPSWAPAVSFGFLLLTLAFRPAGLLGR